MAIPRRHRVAVYHSNRDIRISTRAVPAVGPGEVLFQVHASGICGSDLMEWYRRPHAPTVLGHEVAGRVIAVGDGVREVAVGDRIVATHHVPCLTCHYCLTGRETVCETLRRTDFDPGGFAEFIRLPAVNVQQGILKLPDHVSEECGSMVEPLGCVLRAQRNSGLKAGQSALIIGAGISGCLHLLAARARAAARVLVTDIRPERRQIAAQLGADQILDAADDVADEIHHELGHGVDHAIVCAASADAVGCALSAVDRGGTVSFFAPLEPAETYALSFNEVFWRKGVTLTSSYGAALVDLREALASISSGRIDVSPLITHRLPLSEIRSGFELMLKSEDSLKIIIDPRLDA